jgi:ribosomal protein S27AE
LFEQRLFGHIIGHGDFGMRVGRCPNCGPVLEMHNGEHLDTAVVCGICMSAYRLSFEDGMSDLQPIAAS